MLASIVWRGCEERRWGFFIEGTLTHLFEDSQCRVFDLKQGCNSRYMLALKMGQPVIDLFAHPNASLENGAIAPDAQFVSTFAPVANLTKQKVRISIDVQADITFMASYVTRSGNCTIDMGYNFWALSCEKIKLAGCADCINPLASGSMWALKGDSHVFGYTEIACTGIGTCPIIIDPAFGSIVPLSPSQHCATVHKGLNNFVGPDPNQGGLNGLRPTQNPGVDNAAFAQTAEDINNALPILDRFVPTTGLPIKTSSQPIFLTLNDVDVSGASSKKMSHKLFGALSYRWSLCDKTYVPYLSFGAEVEFGKTSSNECTSKTKDCMLNASMVENSCLNMHSVQKCSYCTLSVWGIWFKGGFSF